MELAPKPVVHKKLKQLAAKQGVSLNAFLVPFLNDIAEERLTRVPHYPPPPKSERAL